jgi:hypothetical protein
MVPASSGMPIQYAPASAARPSDDDQDFAGWTSEALNTVFCSARLGAASDHCNERCRGNELQRPASVDHSGLPSLFAPDHGVFSGHITN